MDAAKSVKAIDGRCTPTLGAAMERTNPERSAGPDAGARPFGSFGATGRLPKGTRPAGRNQCFNHLENISGTDEKRRHRLTTLTILRPHQTTPTASDSLEKNAWINLLACRKQHRYTTKPRSLLKQRKIFNNQRKRPISIYFHSRSIARLMCIYPILPPLVTAKPDTTPNMCLHHDRLDIPSRNMIFRIALPPTSSLENHCYPPLIDVSFRMVLGIA